MVKEQPNDELLHISRALKDYRYLGIADLNAVSSLGIVVMEIKSTYVQIDSMII